MSNTPESEYDADRHNVGTVIPPHIRDILGPGPAISASEETLFNQLLVELVVELAPSDMTDWIAVQDVACATWEIRQLREFKTSCLRFENDSLIQKRSDEHKQSLLSELKTENHRLCSRIDRIYDSEHARGNKWRNAAVKTELKRLDSETDELFAKIRDIEATSASALVPAETDADRARRQDELARKCMPFLQELNKLFAQHEARRQRILEAYYRRRSFKLSERTGQHKSAALITGNQSATY